VKSMWLSLNEAIAPSRAKTIGIIDVDAFAASAGGTEPLVTMTSTLRLARHRRYAPGSQIARRQTEHSDVAGPYIGY
jgi:hypothetical protein